MGSWGAKAQQIQAPFFKADDEVLEQRDRFIHAMLTVYFNTKVLVLKIFG
jgi:hypothetical protein